MGLLFFTTVATATPRKLAVLELVNRSELTPTQARYLTDRVRAAAVDAGYFVLSRENILEHLPPGTTLAACEGECEVTTARNVGADEVVSGEILTLGKEYRVALRWHETQAGRLMNTARVAGEAHALDDALEQATRKMFTRPMPAKPKPKDARVVVRFSTSPPRARVDVDGKQICREGQPIDCRIRMTPGAHKIRISAAGHLPLEEVVTFTAHTERHWQLAPKPRSAVRGPGRLVRQLGWIHFAAGVFEMGDAKRGVSATPPHPVRVGHFQMTRAEITAGQYRRCVRAGACTAPSSASALCTWRQRSDLPVNCVSAVQAAAFCQWVGGRLPSEAEWEFAARDRRDEPYPWSKWRSPSCERAVMKDGRGAGCGRKGAWPVCSKIEGKTQSGLCDMLGNVAEFTADCWHRDYHGAPRSGRAWTDACHADAVVIRGGGFVDNRAALHAAERRKRQRGLPRVDVGFRCAR
jgi:formylglycine-generating enzyme required for sulfatase activity